MRTFGKISADEIRHKTLLVYLEENYEVLDKRQIYEIAMEYIKTVYLRSGHLHVVATNEMLDRLLKRGASNE